MNFNTKPAVTLAAIALAGALSACASKPKPLPDTGPAPQPPATSEPSYPQPPSPPVTGRPIPGSVQDFVINVGDRVYFDLNSYDVRPEAYARLDAQAAWLQRYPGVTVRIEGNADERGTREYNLALGARRAESVRSYLVSRGIPAGLVVVSPVDRRP